MDAGLGRWRRGRRGIVLSAMLGAACVLLLLTAQVVFSPVPGLAPPIARAGADPTNTPPTGAPPTLSLVVPSSGRGPVGASVTIRGAGWGAEAVAVGAALPGANCADTASWVMTLTRAAPDSSGAMTYTFQWPDSLTNQSGPYQICATNSAGTALAQYQVAALAPPSLKLSLADGATATVGTPLTITGTNFVGSGDITLMITLPNGTKRKIETVPVTGSGGLQYAWTPTEKDVGSDTIEATSSAPGGVQPALQASVAITVGAAPTPTVAVTPTPQVTVAPVQPGNTDSGSSVGAIILITALVLLLLVGGAGIALFFILRRRGNGPDGDSAYPDAVNGPGGYGASRPGMGYGPSGDRYGATGQYGRSGMYQPTDPYTEARPGGVSAWADDDAAPGPDWQPRPMTGRWREVQDPYGQPPGPNDSTAGYGPPDPWGNQGGDPYGPTQGYGPPTGYRDQGGYPPPPSGGRRPSGNAGPGTGWSGQRDDQGRAPQGPPQGPRWGEESDDSWTRPDDRGYRDDGW